MLRHHWELQNYDKVPLNEKSNYMEKQMKWKDLKTGFCPKKHYQLVT